MTSQEFIQAADAKLHGIEERLLGLQPGFLESCETELQDLISLLSGQSSLTTSDRTALLEFRNGIRRLGER